MNWAPHLTGVSEQPDVIGDLAKASTAQTAREAVSNTTADPPTRTGPQDRGERLGTFERGGSVRVRELEGFAAVIARAVELAAVASRAGGKNDEP